MPTFEGSLQLVGDSSTKMPAGIRVDGGRLTILAGPSDEIGSWNLGALDIRRKSGSFILTAEGEELLFSVDKPEDFIRLVGIDDAPGPATGSRKKQPRTRRKKKARPPKKPKAKRSKKAIPVEPSPEPGPPPAETKPQPSYLVESTSTPDQTVDPVAEPAPTATATRRSAPKPSLFAALPLVWKIGAGILLVAIILVFLAPGALAAILMVTGMISLALAVVVGTDSIVAARLPAGMTSTTALVAGIILLVLSVLLMITIGS